VMIAEIDEGNARKAANERAKDREPAVS